MHPSSLLSYYPSYAILDEITSYNNYKKLTLYLDLKNIFQTLYMEHAIVNIVETSKRSKYLDTSIFSSLMAFLSFHKIYGMKRGIDINFIIFFESGESYYHKNISKKYKISRKIDNLYGLDRVDRDLFFKVLQSNHRLIEQACNKMPYLKVIRLSHLEADFVPYYLISRKLVEYDGTRAHIIYSNDHDMLQCVATDVYIFSKSVKSKKIIKPGTIMETFLKRPNDIPDIYFPLAMSILGDTGDDIDGIKGVGPVRLLKCFSEIQSMVGNMKEVYNKVKNGDDLFDFVPTKIQNKYLKMIIDAELEDKVISKNLKLISFELLSKSLDFPDKTEMIDRRNDIENIMNLNNIYPIESIKEALTKVNVTLEESALDFLYL